MQSAPASEAERATAKAEAHRLINAGVITTDAELDRFMAARGITPRNKEPR